MTTEEIESKKTIVAICYDFDRTLTPEDMQAQGFIQKIEYEVKKFWDETKELAKSNEMDKNLAWMYKMKEGAEGKELVTKEKLQEYGTQIKFFPGVETWFDRINKYGEENNVIVEHYIISSGLREMIEGTTIAEKFTKIYASSYLYNNKNVAILPAQDINYTNKTQYLFRIEKGCLDVNDDRINDHISPDQLRIPFRNIIYIGDSETDVPCMRLVNSFGGYSIGVYNDETEDKEAVYKMIVQERIKYFVPADYTENSDLEELVHRIIKRTAINEQLEHIYYSCLDKAKAYYNNESRKNKRMLIQKLDESSSYTHTHQIIEKMRKIECSEWTKTEVSNIINIALDNGQVSDILNDSDLKSFFNKIIDTHSEREIICNRDMGDKLRKYLDIENKSNTTE